MTPLETKIAELAADLAVVQRDWRRAREQMRQHLDAISWTMTNIERWERMSTDAFVDARKYLRRTSRRRLALLDRLVKLYGLPE